MPTIALQPLDFELPDLHAFGWVVFTSANGVDAFFERGIARANLDARALAGARVAAIGPGTADALARRGIRADLVPARFVAESLLEAFPEPKEPNERVLIARAETARDVLTEGLSSRGYDVAVLAVYRTVTGSPDPEQLARLRAGEVDAITFTSSSTVTNFCDLVFGAKAVVDGRFRSKPHPGQPHSLLLVSIGPVTSDTARNRGLRVDVEADPHTIDGLVDAVVRALRPPEPEIPSTRGIS